MTINRVTQNMMMDRSYLSLQTGLSRLAKTQEQLSTGRILNRPSDSPTDTTSAMRMRASLADEKQYVRNAEDGLGRLGQIDVTLHVDAQPGPAASASSALQSVNAAQPEPGGARGARRGDRADPGEPDRRREHDATSGVRSSAASSNGSAAYDAGRHLRRRDRRPCSARSARTSRSRSTSTGRRPSARTAPACSTT